MADQDVHEKIAAQIRLIAAAYLNLIALLEKSCPGSHNFVQHRDRKPPWCEACGYTGAGFRVRAGRRNPHCSNCGDERGGPLGHEISECTFDSRAGGAGA